MSTFWEGTGGALIGAALSGIVAVLAVIWTRRDERALMREQMSLTAAHDALVFAYEVRRRIGPFIHAHLPDSRIDWAAAARLKDMAETDAERFSELQAVIRPLRIVDHLSWLWEEFENAHYDDHLDVIVANRDRPGLDSWARNVGQGLTNLVDELNQYLRADLERRELARRPIWRRFRATKRPPFVRRARFNEVIKRDKYGDAEADY